MKRHFRIAATILWVLSIASCGQVETATRPPALLIKDTTAIDAIHGARERMNIVISEGQIETIGSEADIAAHFSGREITTINGTGKYVIPGLWDAHIHLSYNADIGHEVFFSLALAHGVTSLRDTGGHMDLVAPAVEAARADPLTPDLYISGPLLDGPQRVYDGSSPFFPDLSVGIDTPEAGRQKVDELADAGVHFIKAYEMLAPDAFAAIAERASERGLRVAAHIPLSMTGLQAVEAGVSDMQHLRNLEFACSSNSDEMLATREEILEAETEDSPSQTRSAIHAAQRPLALETEDKAICDAFLQTLADNEVYQTPTLTISRFQTHNLLAQPDYRATFDLMPKDIADGWKERSTRFIGLTPSPGAAAYDTWIVSVLPRMKQAGAPIMAGTDAPIGFLTPGASLHEELKLLVDAGLAPLDAIGAATYQPARFFRLEDRQGRLAAGMRADIVILSANPLTDIGNISKIDYVLKDGRVLDRPALDQMLASPSRS